MFEKNSSNKLITLFPEIAKMLGVELNEIFYVECELGEFRLQAGGLKRTTITGKIIDDDTTLCNILNGSQKIVKNKEDYDKQCSMLVQLECEVCKKPVSGIYVQQGLWVCEECAKIIFTATQKSTDIMCEQLADKLAERIKNQIKKDGTNND